MQIAKLVNELKEGGEDFEFYPTTNEILEVVSSHLRNFEDIESVLDIGCGNGKALNFFSTKKQNLKLYGIELSQTLIQNLINPKILILDNDFRGSMLLDKVVDCIFCNPPYKEYIEWTKRILSEAVAKKVVLVIPKRWRENEELKSLLKDCWWFDVSIGEFNFYTSEDRKARAVVEVVCLTKRETYKEKMIKNVLERALETSFGMGELLKQVDDAWRDDDKESENSKELVGAKDLIEYLIAHYQASFKKHTDGLAMLSKISPRLLAKLGVKKSTILETAFAELSSLKSKYWGELINRLDDITCRLNVEQRRDLLRELGERGAEFTKSNIISVILYAIEVVKECQDENFIKYWELLKPYETRKQFKSNEKAYFGSHRYEKPEKIHEGKFDYRIIKSYGGRLTQRSVGGYYIDVLDNCEAIQNLEVLARTMGYVGQLKVVDSNDVDINEGYYYLAIPLGENFVKMGSVTIAKVKAFKNQNLHIFFNQDFLAKLNLNIYKSLGWIKNKKEARECFSKEIKNQELTDLEIDEIFDNSLKLPKNLSNLIEYKED